MRTAAAAAAYTQYKYHFIANNFTVGVYKWPELNIFE